MNGEVITLLGTRADPAVDVVAVDGIPLTRPAHHTLLLHKPAGCITTRDDPRSRDTVMALVPDIAGLHPVGRLDKDTTGLLLLTNDGGLTYALTHPKHHVEKTYRAWVEGVPDHAVLEQLRTGIQLDDDLTAPAQVRRILTRADNTLLELVIHEGRKRQIRRMLLAVGFPVVSLSRVRLGPLELGELPEGKWRELSNEEILTLYPIAGVEPTP